MKNARMTGVLLPLFSLRRKNDHGIGDLAALKEWIDWAADHGVGFLQLLPVNALGEGEAPSPYSAVSSVALEPMYLALEPEWVPGLPELAQPSEIGMDALHPASDPALVDYARVRAWKAVMLKRAWDVFRDGEAFEGRRRDFQDWVLLQDAWLDDFACFRVMSRLFGSCEWWKWPEQDPDRVRLMSEEYGDAMLYEKWLQWLAFMQWDDVRRYADSRGVALMGDIPIGVAMASADVFFERRNFDVSWSGGAPAEGDFADDPFTAKWGQNWGIPLYRWEEMAEDGFAWWKRRIRMTTRIFRMYRVDHILGFYRIYAFPWIPEENPVYLALTPDEAAARCGGRRPGFQPRPDWTEEDRKLNLAQGDRLLRVLLEADPSAAVIGEDLGCVPDYVRPDLQLLRIAGFKIPHWEIREDGHIVMGDAYHPCSFAVYATHDFPPIVDTWNECWEKVKAFRDAEAAQPGPGKEELDALKAGYEDGRRVLMWFAEFCGMNEETAMAAWNPQIKNAMFDALLACRSRYVAMMWTELFDDGRRLNIPGTVGGINWRPRMGFTAEEAAGMEQSRWLAGLAEKNGRV